MASGVHPKFYRCRCLIPLGIIAIHLFLQTKGSSFRIPIQACYYVTYGVAICKGQSLCLTPCGLMMHIMHVTMSS